MDASSLLRRAGSAVEKREEEFEKVDRVSNTEYRDVVLDGGRGLAVVPPPCRCRIMSPSGPQALFLSYHVSFRS